jgi:hypothetical protein
MNYKETKMSKRNWARLWAILGALCVGMAAISACDPYQEANTAAPQVLGVAVIDSFYNISLGGAPAEDTPGCKVPYPNVDVTWANSAFPGLCDASSPSRNIPSACPVFCYPPRTGPAFAPFFTGGLGASYQTGAATGTTCDANLVQRANTAGVFEKVCPTGGTCCAADTYCDVPVGRCVVPDNAKYTYTAQAAYAITDVVSVPPPPSDFFQFATIAIVFNKVMSGPSIQPCPDQLTTTPVATTLCPNPPPPADLRVLVGPIGGAGTDQTANFDIGYFPNSAEQYLGASIRVTPTGDLPLDPATRYHVVGNVKDQQGNSIAVDVTVDTAP